ncbi:ATPase [Desulfocarbo indianensis]|nr:ATPase [Desulfocarbo indianensis]
MTECASGSCSGGAAPAQDEMDLKVTANLDNIRFKLLVMSGKGGVGKSTVAAYLALGLAAQGYQVGLLDVDLHGPSIPRMLGLKDHARVDEEQQFIHPLTLDHGLKALSVEMLLPKKDSSVIWRGPLKIGVIKQFLGNVAWGNLDFLVIDSPPGTGDEPLTIAQTINDAMAVVVTTPQEIALADVRKSIDFCYQMELPILGVVENMSGLTCPHCHQPIELLGKGGGKALAERFGLELLGQIPWDPRLVEASDKGRPLDLSKLEDGAAGPYRDMVGKVLGHTAERKA